MAMPPKCATMSVYVCVCVAIRPKKLKLNSQRQLFIASSLIKHSFTGRQANVMETAQMLLVNSIGICTCICGCATKYTNKRPLVSVAMRLRYLHLHFIAVICNAALTKIQVECIFRCILEFHFAFCILQLSLTLLL